MASYPGALASFAGFTSSHTLSQDNHAAQHNLEQGEILAVQTKVGTGASTPVANTFLHGTGTGTSGWAQVTLTSDVTGILPIANGGTGQGNLTGLSLPSATLVNPVISGTVTGGATYNTPTLTSPAISNFSSATHNHQNNAGGGTLAAAAITGIDKSLLTVDSNPYQFFAYNNTTQSLVSSATKHAFNTELFDTNNNYDTTLSRYTAPVTGIYFISAAARIQALNGIGSIYVYKNGSNYMILGGVGSSGNDSQGGNSTLISLVAGDYLEIFVDNSSGTKTWSGTAIPGAQCNFFTGFLISRT